MNPLIETLDKPDNFNRKVVIEALARMRVDPYYSEYVKFRMPRTVDRIKQERPGFKIEELVDVIGTQEAFLELSKYLLSNVPYKIAIADSQDENYSISYPISNDAFILIRDNLENKDVQDMIRDKYADDNPELIMPLYDWMQKNYGKYKIKRIW